MDYLKARSLKTENTYAYMFALEFEYEGGKQAWHCCDIPFIFNNIDQTPSHNINGVSGRIAEDMSKMLVHFAYKGRPDTKAFKKWKPCIPGKIRTMVIDRNYELKENYDDDLIELHHRSFKGVSDKDRKLSQH